MGVRSGVNGALVAVTHRAGVSVPAVPPGFWDSVALRARRWMRAHPGAARRLRVAWLVWIFSSTIVFLVGLAVVPHWGEGVGAWLWSYLALLMLFVVARTKTVSWRFVALAFSAGCVLAPLIGLADVAVAGMLDADINSHDGAVLVAGPVEESLKLLPLLVLLVVARRRARGLAVVDFVLLGYALGLGLGAVEDTVRRVVAATQPPQASGLGGLLTLGVPEESLGETQWGLAWLPGWSRLEISGIKEEAFFGGHAVTTAIAAAGVGLGLRLRRRLGTAALVIPTVLLGWMILDHALYNDTVTKPLVELDIARPEVELPDLEDLPPAVVENLPPDVIESWPDGGELAVDPHTVEVPQWLRRAWRGWGRGSVERPLLTGLLVAGMVLDVRRVRRAWRGLPSIPDLAGPRWVRARADGVAARLRRALKVDAPRLLPRTVDAVAEMLRWVGHTIADTVHELALSLLALGRDPPVTWAFDHRTNTWSNPRRGWARFDPRRGLWVYTATSGAQAASPDPPGAVAPPAAAEEPSGGRRSRRKRWLVAMTYLRTRRQLAHQLAPTVDAARPRRGFASGVAIAVAVVAAGGAVVYGLSVLHGDDPIMPLDRLTPVSPDGFLANLLDGLADWWIELSFVEQMVLVLGVAALLSFGLAPALGLSWGFGTTLAWVGNVSLIPQYGHGLADLARDPGRAIDDYFDDLTWQQAALDAFTVASEIPGHGQAPNTGSIWRRQVDDITDGADDAIRRDIGEAVPPRSRADVDLPATTRLNPDEVATLHRLADHPSMAGRALTESEHVGADYVDDLGRSIDAMGAPAASRYWNEARFLRQIDNHLLKSNDFTAIDLTGFTTEQIDVVTRYVENLPAQDQARIIRIGF